MHTRPRKFLGCFSDISDDADSEAVDFENQRFVELDGTGSHVGAKNWKLGP
jgi:hypothetical protein